jgi:hypothetical protein
VAERETGATVAVGALDEEACRDRGIEAGEATEHPELRRGEIGGAHRRRLQRMARARIEQRDPAPHEVTERRRGGKEWWRASGPERAGRRVLEQALEEQRVAAGHLGEPASHLTVGCDHLTEALGGQQGDMVGVERRDHLDGRARQHEVVRSSGGGDHSHVVVLGRDREC